MKDSYFSSNDTQQPIALKIITSHSIKRFELPQTLQDLRLLITTSFKNLPTLYTVNYYDEEADCIGIETQQDYENAILFAKNSGLKNLRIYINEQPYKPYQECYCEKFTIDPNKIYESFCYKCKCPLCQRKFESKQSYIKHAKHCFSVFGMKREPFDSQKQRLRYNNKNTVPYFRIRSMNVTVKFNEKNEDNYDWRVISKCFRKELKKWKQSVKY
jgi:hypothetical protein